MKKQKYNYRLIVRLPGTDNEHSHQYISTPYDLYLEHYDPEEGTPARLWIGDDTYIEFEDEVELEGIDG